MNRKLPLLALLCVAASALAANVFAAKSQVYKWVDAAGVVHYADAPPPRGTPNVQTVRVTSSGDQVQATQMENARKSGAQAATAAADKSWNVQQHIHCRRCQGHGEKLCHGTQQSRLAQ